MTLPLPLAAAFITPAFAVAGGLLVAIPIAIHLLNRRRYKTVPWAAMTFLLAALKKNRRRLRFEQWLLLAARCAAIALAGLALARPLGCDQSGLSSLVGRGSGLHVIVLDNSYSMAYEADRPEAKTHFDQAKRLAKGLVGRLSAGNEAVVLITASDPASLVIPQPNYDLAAVQAAIERVPQKFTGTDLPGAFDLALKVAEAESNQPTKTLHLISDSTTSAWRDGHEAVLAQLGPRLDQAYRLVDYRLARENQSNVAVTSLRPENNLVRARFANDFLGAARAFGGPGVEATPLWKLDNETLPGGAAVRIDATSGELRQNGAALRTGGPHVLSLAVNANDRLPIDDVRYRSLDVAAELKILIVEGRRGISALEGSGAFLSLALAPPSPDQTAPGVAGTRKTSSYVQPELISDIELGSKVLGDYRAVVLTDVASVPPAVADQLQRFVQNGGTVIWFMGEQVSSDNYNTVLLPRKLVPGPLTKRITGGTYTFAFNPAGVLHPLLNVFRNLDKSGLDTAQVFTYWQVALSDSSPKPAPGGGGLSETEVTSETNVAPTTTPASALAAPERVLDFVKSDPNQSDADPALLLQRVGDGRVVFFATTADAEWTSFPAKPAYVTLMHELVSGSVSSGDRWLNVDTGRPVEVPPAVATTSVPTLRDPAGIEETLTQVRRPDGVLVYRSRPIDKPGLYRLNTGSATYPVSVNLPATEADIRPLDPAAVKTALGDAEIETLGDTLPPEGAEEEAAGADYGWALMAIVLGLLAFECFIAMRFGHGRVIVTPPAGVTT